MPIFGMFSIASNCRQNVGKAIQAYREGERRLGALYAHATGITDLLVSISEDINQLNEDVETVFSDAPLEERIGPSINVGWFAVRTSATIVGAGQFIANGIRTSSGIGTEEFLEGVAARAERKIGDEGPVPGTFKHTYASRLVDRFQRIYGPVGEGLHIEQSYFGGESVKWGYPGSVRLDVVEGSLANPTAIYDFKFTKGKVGLSASRIEDIMSVGRFRSTMPIRTIFGLP